MLINLTNSRKDEEENFGTVTNSMGKKNVILYIYTRYIYRPTCIFLKSTL